MATGLTVVLINQDNIYEADDEVEHNPKPQANGTSLTQHEREP